MLVFIVYDIVYDIVHDIVLHLVYDVVCTYDIVYDMQYDIVNIYCISYTMSYMISHVFNHHNLRPLKWLARVSDDELCISHCVLIVLHENYMICSVHCAAARAVCTCAAPHPPTQRLSIYIISWALLRKDHLSYTLKVHWN